MKYLFMMLLLVALPWAQESDDKQSAPLGKFLDPDNVEQVNKVADGYTTTKTSKDVYGNIKNKNYKAMLTNTFSKYQNSKAGLFLHIKKFQTKVHAIISKVSQRVDRWRTTVPRLRGYKESITNFADDSYTFSRSFEMKDLWDIDRNFSREMEWRVKHGHTLGTSIWDFLLSRISTPSFLQTVQDIFFPDFNVTLNRSALDGFAYTNSHSSSEKMPIFCLNEAFGVMATVKEMSEEQFSGLDKGNGAMQQSNDNQKLQQALSDDGSSYTDQLQVRQDILNKLYEVNTKRSILKDRSAYLDLLWGRLAQQDVEARQAPTAAIAREISAITKLELNPDNYVLQRYGIEDKKP
jgi:hypothetical protein